MSRKVFISFLGATKYQPARYATHNNNSEIKETRFVQETFINNFCTDYTENDAIYIFLTKKAYAENWQTNKYANETMLPHGLKEVLSQNEKAGIIKPIVDLPDGQNEEEIWQIFNLVYEVLQHLDELVIDVTHAFRSIPILIMTLINYAKFTKSIKVKAIYYGAFDAKNEDGTCQVWNLISYLTLQEYAMGTAIFEKYGRGEYLSEVISNTHADINYQHPLFKQLERYKKLSSSLTELSNCLSINHVSEAINAALILKERIQKVRETQNTIPSLKPFELLLERISEYIEPIALDQGDIFSAKGFQAQLDLIKKSLDGKAFAQAISIARELIVSFIADRLGCENLYDFKTTRKKVEEQINEKAKFLRTNKNIDKCEPLFTNELLVIWNQTIEIRNAIDHAFMDKDKSKWEYKDAKNKVVSACEKIIAYINTDLTSTTKNTVYPSLTSTLLNFSNHPYNTWDSGQIAEASHFGTIHDLPFPSIPPDASVEDVEKMAEKAFLEIIDYASCNQLTVHIMGELTFTYTLVQKLKSAGIPCIASTTERIIKFEQDGTKTSSFTFVRFRAY